jgi:hypothetical protein
MLIITLRLAESCYFFRLADDEKGVKDIEYKRLGEVEDGLFLRGKLRKMPSKLG